MTSLAVAVDDYALATFPKLEIDLAAREVRVLRSFGAVPGPRLLDRLPDCHSAAVVGGRDWNELVQRLEQATATTRSPIIGVLPPPKPGDGRRPDLRWPGVVDLIPPGESAPAERIVLMSKVPIVTGQGRTPPRPIEAMRLPLPPAVAKARSGTRVVGIASSTGGTWVLAQVLRGLTPACRDAIMVAQHLDTDFVPFFAQWLHEVTGWPVSVVPDLAPLKGSTVFLAAGGKDLVLEGEMVRALPACSRFVPSGDRLLGSLARTQRAQAVGMVLSGMGADGAAGLGEIARAGGRAVCQLPDTAVVASMPQSALAAAPGAVLAAPAFLAAALLEG
jgi:hypothetical protein